MMDSSVNVAPFKSVLVTVMGQYRSWHRAANLRSSSANFPHVVRIQSRRPFTSRLTKSNSPVEITSQFHPLHTRCRFTSIANVRRQSGDNMAFDAQYL